MKSNNKIKISVCMVTYNQESYIEEAILGVLNQKCDFPIELLIGDDCSTDNTESIIKNIINTHINGSWINYKRQEENIGLMPNLISLLKRCKGKYIAICEGDDYWIDPNKLQKQVLFLENNPDYILCGHNIKMYDQNNKKFIPDTLFSKKNIMIDIKKLSKKNLLHSPTVVFRNINFDDYNKFFIDSPTWDYPMYLLLSGYGKIMKFNESMAVYRVHKDSVWSSLDDIERISKTIKVLELLIDYFIFKEYRSVVKILEKHEIRLLRDVKIKMSEISKSQELIYEKILFLAENFPKSFVNYIDFYESRITTKKLFKKIFNTMIQNNLKLYSCCLRSML